MLSSPCRPRRHEDYTVAVICAIGFEMSAVRCMLVIEHPRLPHRQGDSNVYILGELSGHNVALRLLDGHSAFDNEDKARLAGFVGGLPCVAVPDTGSTIMAMAASFAADRGRDIDPTRRIKVRFADGSEATTLGTATASWALREDDYPVNYEWHVLEGLSVNAILSIDYIKSHDIFGGEHESSFVDADTAVDWEHSDIFGILRVAEGSEELGKLADDFFTDSTSFSSPQLLPLLSPPISSHSPVLMARRKMQKSTPQNASPIRSASRSTRGGRRSKMQSPSSLQPSMRPRRRLRRTGRGTGNTVKGFIFSASTDN